MSRAINRNILDQIIANRQADLAPFQAYRQALRDEEKQIVSSVQDQNRRDAIKLKADLVPFDERRRNKRITTQINNFLDKISNQADRNKKINPRDVNQILRLVSNNELPEDSGRRIVQRIQRIQVRKAKNGIIEKNRINDQLNEIMDNLFLTDVTHRVSPFPEVTPRTTKPQLLRMIRDLGFNPKKAEGKSKDELLILLERAISLKGIQDSRNKRNRQSAVDRLKDNAWESIQEEGKQRQQRAKQVDKFLAEPRNVREMKQFIREHFDITKLPNGSYVSSGRRGELLDFLRASGSEDYNYADEVYNPDEDERRRLIESSPPRKRRRQSIGASESKANDDEEEEEYEPQTPPSGAQPALVPPLSQDIMTALEDGGIDSLTPEQLRTVQKGAQDAGQPLETFIGAVARTLGFGRASSSQKDVISLVKWYETQLRRLKKRK